MPTFTVQINVNVPGVGDRVVNQPGILAASLMDAIAQATANIKIDVLQVQRTAP